MKHAVLFLFFFLAGVSSLWGQCGDILQDSSLRYKVATPVEVKAALSTAADYQVYYDGCENNSTCLIYALNKVSTKSLQAGFTNPDKTFDIEAFEFIHNKLHASHRFLLITHAEKSRAPLLFEAFNARLENEQVSSSGSDQYSKKEFVIPGLSIVDIPKNNRCLNPSQIITAWGLIADETILAHFLTRGVDDPPAKKVSPEKLKAELLRMPPLPEPNQGGDTSK